LASQVQLIHFAILDFDFLAVGAAVEFGSDFEAGVGGGVADVTQQRVQRAQRNASPVLADGTEQAMFHGIPLRGAARVMGVAP